MTKFSNLHDNGGICERCNDPETKGKMQRSVGVMLGGGLGVGTMWVCWRCEFSMSKQGTSDRKGPA